MVVNNLYRATPLMQRLREVKPVYKRDRDHQFWQASVHVELEFSEFFNPLLHVQAIAG